MSATIPVGARPGTARSTVLSDGVPPDGVPPDGALLDGDERTAPFVELVQVLGDAVAGTAVIGPAGQPLVDDRAALAHLVGHTGHPEQIAAQLVHAAGLIGGAHVGDLVGDAVGLELGAHVPLANARRVAVAPHPPPMEVAGLGADADAAEVHVVADVDGEPAPHGRAAPAPGPPRLVAVAARVGPQGMTLVVDLDPPRPAPGLLEMAL